MVWAHFERLVRLSGCSYGRLPPLSSHLDTLSLIIWRLWLYVCLLHRLRAVDTTVSFTLGEGNEKRGKYKSILPVLKGRVSILYKFLNINLEFHARIVTPSSEEEPCLLVY
ncbi:hypothetical protein PoB_007372100 [Plakobranchus ocellatus]|uniref:Uncharacterized protein n=1 Tax=Plakobranchus ocellatus TaxID=259542 RepID=A0AAV4DTK2_9GAST|nr:hypothetical protein PoB_007372100 [Plakobranchus ocellatus]